MSKAESLYDFIWMTRPLVQQIEETVETGLLGSGLTVRMRAVLEVLARDGSSSVPDLAHALEIGRQYVQLMVNDCLAAGMVVKRPNPRHKRSPLIVLTREGGDLITTIRAEEMARLEQIAKRLSIKDIDTALSVAQHVLSAFRHLNGERR
ncbi:MarR family winged helix-turn-helix transcriptional regulator [Rhodobacteraceae bacterium D3-12]|nr:MarR family winged helix-turn-helix transcriptional regulator [Rhodobacteraceae bacterium D3-12]